MDLSQYSTEQLKNLLEIIPAELKRREKETKVKLRQDLEELAKKHGFSLDELLGESKPVKAKGSVAPKYRHPSDVSLTWTGRAHIYHGQHGSLRDPSFPKNTDVSSHVGFDAQMTPSSLKIFSHISTI